jgi:hypothetical protein
VLVLFSQEVYSPGELLKDTCKRIILTFRLTLALMGSDDLNLRVLATSSDSPSERKQASKVLKLLAKGRHWVLVVLLLSNVVGLYHLEGVPRAEQTGCQRVLAYLPGRRPGWWCPGRHCFYYHDCHLWRSYSSSCKLLGVLRISQKLTSRSAYDTV